MGAIPKLALVLVALTLVGVAALILTHPEPVPSPRRPTDTETVSADKPSPPLPPVSARDGDEAVASSDLPAERGGAAETLGHLSPAELEAFRWDIEERARQLAQGDGARDLTPAELYTNAAPAVVMLRAKDDDGKEIGTGSGFFVSPREIASRWKGWAAHRAYSYHYKVSSGFVLTNHHVIRAAASVEVDMADGRTGRVPEIVAEDEKADLALLVVTNIPRGTLPTLTVSSGEPPVIGAPVYAIGNPQGLANSLSNGIVSGQREAMGGVRWLQTTAPISPGSSGGPLLNCRGEVVGVTTSTFVEGQNLNFAVPAAEVRRLLTGPLESREVWRGSSVMAERRDAFSSARVALQWSRATVAGKAGKNATAGPSRQLETLVSGIALREQHQYADAVRVLERAARETPGEFEFLVYYALADAYLAVSLAGGESGPAEKVMSEKATAALVRSVALKRDFSPTYDHLCNVHLAARRYTEALVAAENLVRLAPRCWLSYFQRALALSDMKRHGAALENLRIAADLKPTDAGVQWIMGSEYTELGEHDKAVEAYLRAVKLDPQDAWSYVGLARQYRSRREYAKAVSAYGKALEYGEKLGAHKANIERERADCLSQMR